MPRKPDGSHKGFAFVEFSSASEVNAALEEKQVSFMKILSLVRLRRLLVFPVPALKLSPPAHTSFTLFPLLYFLHSDFLRVVLFF